MPSAACSIGVGDYTILIGESLLASPLVSLTPFEAARGVFFIVVWDFFLMKSSSFLSGLPPCRKKIIVNWSMPFMAYSKFLK